MQTNYNMSRASMFESLNKIIIPRAKLNDTLSNVLSARSENIKLDNVLIIGDSGTGKSHTLAGIKTLWPAAVAELNMKFVNAKTAKFEITETIRDLYISSKFNKAEAENGIILIDNIEELAKSKAQLELIKLVRGTNYKITGFEDSNLITDINTQKLLFICTAGTRQLKTIKSSSKMTNMNKQVIAAEAAAAACYRQKLIELGIVSELINLFAITIILDSDLKTIKQLVPVLTAAALAEYSKKNEFNVKIIIDNKVLEHIVNVANLIRAGIWGLKIIIHDMLQIVTRQIITANLSNIVVISYSVVDDTYVITNTLAIT
ncbi:ATP-dependent Clp protease ATP-binding subunit ClpX [Candidatus Hodgkinia cicadicola]|nr:ATP-dependent Clp protease ATP-binding subunit ClpX [Candidatus Hodgkinia cicadicola]